MRDRHPHVAWETEFSRKWQKNVHGKVGLSGESVELLHELFPKGRYYSRAQDFKGVDASSVLLSTQGPYRRNTEVSLWPGAKEYFHEGPSSLWKALWGPKDELWDIYPGAENFEGLWGEHALIDEVLTNLEMKLFSSMDSDTALCYEDLGRSIVVYRTLYDGNLCRDCVRAYICVRLALAGMAPSLKGVGIYDLLSTHLAYLEYEQVRLNHHYQLEVEFLCGNKEIDLYQYAMNPFAVLVDFQTVPRFIGRYEYLDALAGFRHQSV